MSPSPKTNQGGTRASPTIWISIGSKLANVEERDHSKQFSTLRCERGTSWNMWDYPWLHASLLHYALSRLQKIYPLLKKKFIQLALSRTIGGAPILLEQNTCDKMGLKQCTNMSSITFFPSSQVNALVACYRFHSIWIPNTPCRCLGTGNTSRGYPRWWLKGFDVCRTRW